MVWDLPGEHQFRLTALVSCNACPDGCSGAIAMTIPLVCPHCSASLSAPESRAGKRATCPGCGKKMQVPSHGATWEVQCHHCGASNQLGSDQEPDCILCTGCHRYFDASDELADDESSLPPNRKRPGKAATVIILACRCAVWAACIAWTTLVMLIKIVGDKEGRGAIPHAAASADAAFWVIAGYCVARGIDSILRSLPGGSRS